MQGETDAGLTSVSRAYSAYGALLKGLLDNWRLELLQPDLRFTVVQVTVRFDRKSQDNSYNVTLNI